MEPTDAPEPARPVPVEAHPDGVQSRRPERPAPLSAHPGIPERFREVVRPLDAIDDRPVADHPQSYDAVHRDLRAVLDDVDRAG